MQQILISIIILLFSVAPVMAQTSFRFVSWGDTKDGTVNLGPLSNQAKATNPVFTIYSGDLVPDNLSSSLLDTWKKAINGGTSSVSDTGNGMFNITLPVRGNHDFDNTSVWEAYFDMPATVARVGGSNYSAFETDRTYSFDYSNSHFVGIDVDGDSRYMTSAQLAWLDTDLAAAEQRGLTHAFLYFHGPIYPVAEHSTAPINTAITAVIYKHPIVSATFHGHEHTLAYAHIDKTRIANMTGAQGDRSFEEFVTANAGVRHTYQCLKPTEYCMTGTSGSADACPWDGQYCSPPVWGFATIDVNGNSYTVSAYRSGVADPVKTWTFTKGVAPTPLPSPQPTTSPNPTATPKPTSTPTPTPTPQPGTTSVVIRSAGTTPGDIWKYNDKGVALDSAWKSITYDDSSWSSGPSKLGYGDGNENTVVSYGPDSSNKFITTYFRKSFSVSDLASVTGLTLKLKRDDGAVVYLNGTEVYRSNMPTGTVSYTTLASSTVEANSFETATLNPQLLQTTNVLSVEVHQVSPSNSTDMAMDLELSLTRNSTAATPTPTLAPTPTPVPCQKQLGDADCNGVVDRNDFLVWIYEVSSLQTTKTADFNGDGVINTGDYALWRIKFLNITANPTPGTTPTPNPTPAPTPTPTPNASAKIYYVDCSLGNDANTGLSQTTPWKTLAAVNSKLSASTSLSPGDQLLLKRGCVFSDPLKAPWTGTAAAPITISAYGSGADPEINHKTDNTDAISFTGSYLHVSYIRAVASAPAYEIGCQSNPVGYMIGYRIKSTAHHIVLDHVYATGYYAGAYIELGANNNSVKNSTFDKNIMMHPLDTTGGNDAGAFGVLVHGSYNTIVNNSFTNHNACSYDYVNDGAAVEIYRGQNNLVAQNVATQNDTFSELGGDATKANNNTYVYNLVTSNLPNSIFMVVRGSGSSYGPTTNTKVYNNTVYLTGSSSQGMICHAGCSSSILTLKNNILWAQAKSIYSDAAFDEANNLYWKTGGNPTIQGTISASSIKVDPLFVQTGTNFHLSSASPAKNKGLAEVLNTGITSDLVGISVPQGTAVDLGAYELPL